MNTIQELIRRCIDSNGYTIYSLSQQTGINRTTLQKIISGQRTLTKDIYETLLRFFVISPSEREALDRAFLIDQIGRERYQTHMEIKHILELPASVFQTTSEDLTSALITNLNELPDFTLLKDEYQITNVLCSIVLSNVTECEQPYLYGYTDMSQTFMSTILKQFFNTAYEKLNIKLLLEFRKARLVNGYYDNIDNLHIITNLLPFFSAFPGTFAVHYYYAEQNDFEQLASVFPFYIITNTHVILFSADYTSALFISNSALHEHYLSYYNQALNHSYTLTNGIQTTLELLESLIHVDPLTNYHLCLNVQPTIEKYITPDMIDKYMLDTPYKDVLRQKLLERIDQLATEDHTILFTMEGLRLFCDRGKNINFPDTLAKPFDIEDRIYILSKFLESNRTENSNTYLLLNPKQLHTSPYISIAFVPPALTFILLIREDGNALAIPLYEHTLCNNIIDYIQALPEYGCIYSLEETNHQLEQEIEVLSAKL